MRECHILGEQGLLPHRNDWELQLSVTRQIRVCAFTGSRADYSHLSGVLRRLHDDPDIQLHVLASGGHLVDSQGMTVHEIEQDGVPVDERIEMVLASETPTGVGKSLGLAIIGYTEAFSRLRPDVLLVVGDRYETLAAAVAALPHPVVIAHIGGGQLTYGSIDERARHAISKLAHVHFVLDSADRERVVQMGEDPAMVHVVGARLAIGDLLSRQEVERVVGLPLRPPVFTVTFHPVTADEAETRTGIEELLSGLESFTNSTLIFTSPNVDIGSSYISSAIKDYVSRTAHRAAFISSLGRRRYMSLLSYSDAVIGNSSSGIIEAPGLHVPSVNVGSRQAGRRRASSVVDVACDATEITSGIKRALSIGKSNPRNPCFVDPDDDNDVILETLKNLRGRKVLAKSFNKIAETEAC
ncbi:UDP-N-acetylglucosamine 2-epimerase [Amycolatopsis sp.]|uniref:UDP-N-acetylglucosamine 2-epimerase n=1 Tax=Amycolatopsis sp. TaxID=37632 RepID=UPI002C870334|nr:UDP-N-acetylglucosamine 2-epimerase [Amycolatopsis sp.]HVV11196.1 UDP-N-acetylglucosamine 2-epimerase [Amycolatopsis sp.]